MPSGRALGSWGLMLGADELFEAKERGLRLAAVVLATFREAFPKCFSWRLFLESGMCGSGVLKANCEAMQQKSSLQTLCSSGQIGRQAEQTALYGSEEVFLPMECCR